MKQKNSARILLIFFILGLIGLACREDNYTNEDEYLDGEYEYSEEETWTDEEPGLLSETIDGVEEFFSDQGSAQDWAPDLNGLAAGEFRLTECPIDLPASVTVECGYFGVSENRVQPSGRTLALAVVILRASSSESKSDPIVYMAGGPGGSALDDLQYDLEGWLDYPFTKQHDLIFVDQRGTGYSLPTLNCSEIDEIDYENSNYADPDFEAMKACRARLVNEGIDLSAYSSAENAADFAELRQALGIEEWNVLGISYGTRLALALMRDHPDGVRSVILDSPFPPQVDLPLEEAIGAVEALQTLFAGCAAEPLCNDAYPNLEQRFYQLVDRLNNNPEWAELYDYDYDEYYEQEVYGDDLVGVLFDALYDPYMIPLLPRLVADVEAGYYEVYSMVLYGWHADDYSRRQEDELDFGDSEGMFNSVTCHDEFAFGSLNTVEDAVYNTAPVVLQNYLIDSVAAQFTSCDMWGAGKAADIENQPVYSDIPTLIMVGEYDPVTPPRWGQLTAETLSQSYYFEFPARSHSISSDIGCPIDIMNAFIENPYTEPDRSCLSAMTGAQFFLPEEDIPW